MNLYGVIGGSVGACVLLGYLGRGVRAIYRWAQRIGQVLEQVKERSTQLEPNGGSSMRDAVNRTENTLLAVKEHLREQDEHLRSQDALIAELRVQNATIAQLQAAQRPRRGLRG